MTRTTIAMIAALALPLSMLTMPAVAQETRPAAPETKSKPLPTGSNVLERAQRAIGGKAAVDRIASARMRASLSSPMGESTMELFWTRTGQCLMRTTLPGMGVVEQGTDGTVGWGTNPMTGKPELIRTPAGAKLRPLADRTSPHLMIRRFIKDFGKAETIERRDFDGRACYVVRLTEPRNAHDTERTVFFDVRLGLPVAVQMTMSSPMGEQQITQTIKRWVKKDGIKVAEQIVFSGTGQPDATMSVTDLEFNKVDPKVLAMPESLQKQANQAP